MKDANGVYYYPAPGETKTRVYIRKGEGEEIEFRLWSQEEPQIWEKHGWVPYEAIRQAASLYKQERSSGADPMKIYDLKVAKALLNQKG